MYKLFVFVFYMILHCHDWQTESLGWSLRLGGHVNFLTQIILLEQILVQLFQKIVGDSLLACLCQFRQSEFLDGDVFGLQLGLQSVRFLVVQKLYFINLYSGEFIVINLTLHFVFNFYFLPCIFMLILLFKNFKFNLFHFVSVNELVFD